MDTTPDISHCEQLSIIIRIVHIDLENESSCSEIKEYFMDFVHINSTTGMDLSNILIEKLKEYGLDINNCRGQAYDNGANMAGLYKGVRAHILNQNPRAFFVPCAAHSLNLCLKDAGGSSSQAQLFFGMIERIYVLFSASINRWEILKNRCNKLSIKKWAETRWDSRVNAVKAIRFQLNEVVEALEEISDTTKDLKIKSETHSLAKEICSYEFILSLIIWYDILCEINIVSKSLQLVTIDLDVSASLLNSLIIFLGNYRENGYTLAKVKAEK
ncbi:zinc finger MYM-type protein 1-like [Acyrthosiphon pisum]|uniref:Zinc finger MYM-type protein 1 n=1 Tax=Acyrthosiphon pisum TaxID=7029 RepID=A0A8R1WYD5_ACYPI|nr:zinc finger MYM-type protein 1-like [Acyrthosiphon pisum]|eukprot:XP_008178799.1 PREDICTED: zinc finger MYM-type protein 1-like [Acyrthosiphon pisum]